MSFEPCLVSNCALKEETRVFVNAHDSNSALEVCDVHYVVHYEVHYVEYL